jgi:hypothetical protein
MLPATMTKLMSSVLLFSALTEMAAAQPSRQSPPLPAQSQPQSQPQSLPLRVVDRRDFCRRLGESFATVGKSIGFDQVQTVMLASAAPDGLVREFRAGRATDYLNAEALGAFVQAAPAAAVGVRPDARYLPLTTFVGYAMGIERPINLALSAGELRFIPHAQRGMELVVIAQNGAALTPERARKVAEVARAAAIKISVVWVGPAPTEHEAAAQPALLDEARTLAWIAATTGGAFANLGGTDSPCSPSI